MERQIQKAAGATRDRDIEAYMSTVPADLRILGEDGQASGREQLRANVLRDWSIIVKTPSIDVHVEKMEVQGDSATVYTRQRWEPLMLERDGKTVDKVLTTQRHRELWRRTPSRPLPAFIASAEEGGDTDGHSGRAAGKPENAR